jgi:muramoyltetrapeptide carboxypeptidase
MKIIEPKLLKKGDKIALISPAGFVNEEKLHKAVKTIELLGFEPFYENSILDKNGYLAGKDFDRAFELNRMFSNKSVKAIMCIRGGYGSTRILNLIDYRNIRNNPKIFVGYSDITALNFAIYKHSNLITYHGVAGVSDFGEYTSLIFNNLFVEEDKNKKIKSLKYISENEEFLQYTLRKFEKSGKLIGGNLSLIVSLIGTNYFIDFKDKLLFIEEINEAPYKVDRMLNQLLLSTNISNSAGIIFGVFNKCNFDSFNMNKENSLSISKVINDFSDKINVPVSYGFSFGHIDNQAIIPFGKNAFFDSDNFEINLL